MKQFLLLTILIAAGVLPGRAQVSVEQRIDTMQILIGQQTNLTISVSLKKGQKLSFPEFKRSQELTPGLEVLEGKKPDSLNMADGMLKVSKTYVLTAFNENLYPIPPINVKVDGKQYSTKPLALKVLTVPVDTVHADKIFPPKDVQDNPFQWSEWSPVFWLSVLFAVLLALAIYITVRVKANKPVVTPIRIVRHLPPHQKAMKGIEKLKDDKAALSGDQKEYYTELTDIIRKYIAERFGFDAMEMTSTEIIASLRSEGNSAIDEIVSLFRTADLVKFARHSALVNENDANLMSALSFINDTKTEEKEAVKVVENKEEKVKQNGRKAIIAVCAVLFAGAVAALCFMIYNAYTLLQ